MFIVEINGPPFSFNKKVLWKPYFPIGCMNSFHDFLNHNYERNKTFEESKNKLKVREDDYVSYARPKGTSYRRKRQFMGGETDWVPLEGALVKSTQTKHSKAREGKQKKKSHA